MEVSGQHHVPAALASGKTAVHVEWEIRWARRVGLDILENIKFLCPAGIRTPDRKARSPVTILTELFRLSR
jgi:hypothetical protein